MQSYAEKLSDFVHPVNSVNSDKLFSTYLIRIFRPHLYLFCLFCAPKYDVKETASSFYFSEATCAPKCDINSLQTYVKMCACHKTKDRKKAIRVDGIFPCR